MPVNPLWSPEGGTSMLQSPAVTQSPVNLHYGDSFLTLLALRHQFFSGDASYIQIIWSRKIIEFRSSLNHIIQSTFII